MHVTHIEWENEFNVIIFQCGWYRGIIVYLALKERSCSFRAFLVSFIIMIIPSRTYQLIVQQILKNWMITKKRSVQTYGIHDRSKQKRHSRNQ